MANRNVTDLRTLRLSILSLLFLTGCHWGTSAKGRVPEVKTRFTANPLTMSADCPVVASSQVPRTRVGLAMQSSTDPAEISFASRLGTVLIRELQLSSGGFRVTPLAAVELRTVVPSLETNDVSDVVTVALQEPTDTLPPHLPPSPFYDTSTPVLVDQIMVIRVLEYRPYYPMLATLDLRVLNGESQEEMFATTATWSGDDYLLADECCEPKSWWWSCNEPECGPAPGHNSPQALMHEIAKDVTGWYLMSTDPMMSGVVVTISESLKSTTLPGATSPAAATQSGSMPGASTPEASTPEATVESGVTHASHATVSTQTRSDKGQTEPKSRSRKNAASGAKTKSSNGKTPLPWPVPKFALPKQSDDSKKLKSPR
jgi:hypothetical protein